MPKNTLVIDWTDMSDNARPIYAREVEQDFAMGGEPLGEQRIKQIKFGYQYTDKDGRNQQEVQVITSE